MNRFALTTPVVLLVFNRPAPTERVFSAIREARPARLLVVADGPRSDRAEDFTRCGEVRNIVEQIDWPCAVERVYAEENMGCKRRVASGLDWVFSRVEEAIILEDDCLPDPTFFRFCQEMLDRYRDDERVMSVCGSNPLGRWKADLQRYHFSLYGGVWGWATWRRAWRFYDVDMTLWLNPESRLHICELLGGGNLYRMRALEFDRVAAGHVDTWDYQWSFAQLNRSGLTLVSATNLVSNIGFNADATHTVNPNNAFAALPTLPCQFPLEINHLVAADPDYDAELLTKSLSERPFLLKLSDVMHHLWGSVRDLVR